MQSEFPAILADIKQSLRRHPLVATSGRLTGVLANRLETDLPGLAIGEICRLDPGNGAEPILAQVVGLSGDGSILTPLGATDGLSPATRVAPLWRPLDAALGAGMLGGVFDGLGRPTDGRAFAASERRSLSPRAVNPLSRPLVDRPAATGIRAVDGLLTLGIGQRIGVFGSAGTGKTSFVGMLARNFNADVVVMGLIGERGREIREFLDRQLPPATRARSVVIAATSDMPAMERVAGAHLAATVAEYFRDQDQHVLLIIDSVTRFARALREVGLSAGEAAVRRGFPPSVYAELPRLIERGGRTDAGSITAIYTVLAEDETGDDPIVEEVQSLADGHIHLSKKLAQSGHYPAIDVLKSNSRLMSEIVSPEHLAGARRVRELMAKHQDIEFLAQVGEYRRGADALGDAALDSIEAIRGFLRQDAREASQPSATLGRLAELVATSRRAAE